LKIIVTGGTGFLGAKLVRRLLQLGALAGADGRISEVERIVVCDVAPAGPAMVSDPRIEIRVGDFSTPEGLAEVIDGSVDLVFHLAGVVSGGAEADFDLGMKVNLDGSRNLLEALRQTERQPRIVFTSSVAVYGGDMPAVVQDDTHLTPRSSYGMQKAAVELLINEYSRKGFVDGRAVRLPTIVVRAGRPNAAASSFASSIIREPLDGEECVCPVSEATEMWIMSPRQGVESLIHAAQLPADALGSYRGVALPGLTVSMREMVEALSQVAGVATAQRVSFYPDPVIERIVTTWPARFDTPRALAMGFKPDAGIREIVQSFVDDDMELSRAMKAAR
jgi:D-erythronate 2-dehydrogenase